MKTLGIIAEYNPFHNGHQFHIEASKKASGADYVVVVMSGDFVQRGEPAIIDKYSRARAALLCGADLVIEMPAAGALSSAEGFASCGVAILDAIGADFISFGAETNDLAALQAISDILADEPEDFKAQLGTFLKQGLSFPSARAKAIAAITDDAQTSALLAGSNNILAIEYLKAIKRLGSSITPVVIKREGALYNDTALGDSFASATGIRADILTTGAISDETGLKIPEESAIILTEAIEHKAIVFKNDFSQLLFHSLIDYSGESDLDNRIEKCKEHFTDFESFCMELKSKNQTYTAISRYLTCLMLGITDSDTEALKSCGYAPYVRILGFTKGSGALIKNIKENCSVPVINSIAKEKSELADGPLSLLELDIKCADIYNYISNTNSDRQILNDFRHPQVII